MSLYQGSVSGTPIELTKSTEASVYAFFALAMGLSVSGVFFGIQAAAYLMNSGLIFGLFIVELAIIFSARFWVEKSPLNYLLFGLFPFISGLTITPFILHVLTGYANGGVVLLNAASTTFFMAAAAAVFARTTKWNLGVMGKALFFAVIGLIVMSILQIFIPGLQSTQMELLISGAGVVIFALFTAYDMQRVANMSRNGANPLLLALSLYLDIFNLFLYVLRFMLVLYGDRR